MLKLKTGSNTGSDTLTRDPTRPGQSRWPDDPWPGDPVPFLELPIRLWGSYFSWVVSMHMEEDS